MTDNAVRRLLTTGVKKRLVARDNTYLMFGEDNEQKWWNIGIIRWEMFLLELQMKK
jgi:hypothetical protein